MNKAGSWGGLIELFLVFGAFLGLCLWELYDLKRDRSSPGAEPGTEPGPGPESGAEAEQSYGDERARRRPPLDPSK